MNSATNKFYVVCENSVTVIDGSTYGTTAVPIGGYAVALAVNPVTNKIYTADGYSSTKVTVIDGATNSTADITAGNTPYAVAVNPVTNKIYVANLYGNSVTVIDGATLSTSTVAVGNNPDALAVNTATNKIYVANECCEDGSTVTVIDGATLSTSTVNVGISPVSVAVNRITNKIYVANLNSSNVTVIDGLTLSTNTIVAGTYPDSVAINESTNKIYVSNEFSDNVTVIDGGTLSTLTVGVGQQPVAVAVEPASNKIYVVNLGEDIQLGTSTVTVVDGGTNSTITLAVGLYPYDLAINPATGRVYVTNSGDNTVSVIAGPVVAQFVPVTPCRVVDTRNANGTFGGPSIQGGTFRSFPIPQSNCSIPVTAAAYSLNVTVVPPGPLGYLTIWPTGEYQPVVSTMNSLDGRIKANAAIVPAGNSSAVNVYASNTTNVVLDIDGYFAPAGASTLAFYPLPPCRVADTRSPPGDLGGPYLTSGMRRDFPLVESNCGIPNNAQAYSLNFTAVPLQPGQPLGYLTVWPTGQPQPVVSSLNNLTGTIVANAALVPAGTDGKVAVYPSNDTNLVIDVNGYFAPPGSGALMLYAGVPCRALDTRQFYGAFSGELTIDLGDSPCQVPSTVQAYVLNATVVPVGPLGYLTLWPDGGTQPQVSTLNAIDGAITSNMAIVPANNGSIDAFASNLTQLILDITGYFAP